MSGGPVTTYDFTSYSTAEADVICEHLRLMCREWCFQKEKCPKTNNEHYQGRVHLARKMRLQQAIDELCQGPLAGAHISPTSNHNQGNNFYVMKADTRCAGPWNDKDEKPRKRTRAAKKIEEHGLRPWQAEIIRLAKIEDDRKIYYILDEKGGIGKSTLLQFMNYKGLAQRIPALKDAKDVMRMVMDTRKKVENAGHNCYIIDVPREVPMKTLREFFSAIETVKDGYAFDDRFHFREEYFDGPAIFVFCNTLPPLDVYSAGRWEELKLDI